MDLKGIRLISEFMGWTTHTRINYLINEEVEEYDTIKLPEKLGYINDGYINIKSAEFDNSWDWLMPVVEKIQSINETDQVFGALIDITTTRIRIKDGDFEYVYSRPNNNYKPFDISKLCEGVIKYIEWYNGTMTTNP